MSAAEFSVLAALRAAVVILFAVVVCVFGVESGAAVTAFGVRSPMAAEFSAAAVVLFAVVSSVLFEGKFNDHVLRNGRTRPWILRDDPAVAFYRNFQIGSV